MKLEVLILFASFSISITDAYIWTFESKWFYPWQTRSRPNSDKSPQVRATITKQRDARQSPQVPATITKQRDARQFETRDQRTIENQRKLWIPELKISTSGWDYSAKLVPQKCGNVQIYFIRLAIDFSINGLCTVRLFKHARTILSSFTIIR